MLKNQLMIKKTRAKIARIYREIRDFEGEEGNA
jgi:hypothetical protein